MAGDTIRTGAIWVTPEKSRNEAIIRMEGIEDGATVLKEVKISGVASKGVKGIKITKGGTAIIEGRDNEQIDSIKRELDKHKEFFNQNRGGKYAKSYNHGGGRHIH